MARCTAKTAKGTRCRNKSMKDSKLCGSHGVETGRPVRSIPSAVAIAATKDTEAQTYGQAICGLVRMGMRRGPAAERMRVHRTTLAAWIERGEADIEANVSSEFADFLREITVAHSAFMSDMLQQVHRAAKGTTEKPGDWRAAMALLERLRPEDFSPTAKLEHSGAVNIVEQHAEQLIGPLMAVLTDLGVADDPRVPDLVEKHFSVIERHMV